MTDGKLRKTQPLSLVLVLLSVTSCKQQPSSGGADIAAHTSFGTTGDIASLSTDPDVDLVAGETASLSDAEQVVPVHRRPDRSVLVWDYNNRQLRLISAQGTLIARSPGKGAGPGEFNSHDGYIIRRIAGDSVAVLERIAGRVNIFDDRLRFIRRYRVMDKESLNRIPTESVIFDDGSVLISDLDSLPCRPGLNRYTARWSRVSPSGSSISYGELFVSESFGKIEEKQRYCYELTKFRPKAAFASSGMHLYYTEGSSYHIRKFDERGNEISVVKLVQAPPPVTEADIAVVMATDPEDPTDRDKLLRMASPMPEAMPAIRDLHVDALGLIWAGEYPRHDRTQKWRLFDSTGSYRGSVTSPPRFRIVEIGVDYVLGHRWDEDDTQRVRVYSLSRQ